MSKKTCIEVVIAGKVYKLGGYEDADYLQRVAAYLNNKNSELRSFPNYSHLSADQRTVLLQLNIADDFFKAKGQITDLEKQLEQKDQITYDVKHDLSAAQIKAEKDKVEIRKLREENEKLRAELAAVKNNGSSDGE